MNPSCRTAAGGALALAMICSFAGCKGVSQTTSAETRKSAQDPNAVQAQPALLKQLVIGEPVHAMVSATLRVAGRVEADETRQARVSSPVTGRIVDLDVVEGQDVKRGDVLAVIRSTELADSQFGYLRALSQRQLAERAVARAKRLLDAGVIGEAELQRREAEVTQANAELSSLRDQLKVLGMADDAMERLASTRAVNSVSNIVASIDGTVLSRKVTVGQVVQPADTVFLLADLSSVWLVADVPEQTAGHLAPGVGVTAEIAALPGQPVSGKLKFVSAIVNAETRTVQARMDLPNPAKRYKPAMLATMMLQEGSERHLVIPPTAVVRENNADHVFFQTAPDRFVLRRVELGPEIHGVRAVLEGLQPGDKIVMQGGFHLNNERKRLALQGE
jgi:cobalt-zinc-cadmium efflux system membrane fusion protein